MAFYYSSGDYEMFLKFFEFLGGKVTFDYDQYVDAYSEFMTHAEAGKRPVPAFFESANSFLQFLYELNIISYNELTADEKFQRWCFRERTYSNISPKVKAHERYGIHYGLARALNTGKPIRRGK